jgi:hypothetical protein
LGGPSVGIDGLPWEDAVDPWLGLLEPDLDEDGDGMDGEPELEELDADGIEGEFELELDEEGDGIEGDELLELELELEDAVGIEGEELELLWLVSVLQAARIRLSADAVISALTGNRVTGPFMFCPCRVHDLFSRFFLLRLRFVHASPSPDIDRADYRLISAAAGQHFLDNKKP